jgi:hypothetical protein
VDLGFNPPPLLLQSADEHHDPDEGPICKHMDNYLHTDP